MNLTPKSIRQTAYIVCLSILLTGDVTSAKHRYELLEGDVMWEEARRDCDLRGGYLAAITSWEELEQIKEQIVAEGQEDISFWVGANYERDLKGDSGLTMGFRWIDPDAESAYGMFTDVGFRAPGQRKPPAKPMVWVCDGHPQKKRKPAPTV